MVSNPCLTEWPDGSPAAIRSALGEQAIPVPWRGHPGGGRERSAGHRPVPAMIGVVRVADGAGGLRGEEAGDASGGQIATPARRLFLFLWLGRKNLLKIELLSNLTFVSKFVLF